MKRLGILFATALGIAPTTDAAELPRMFSDGMVLQRDTPIVVWGRSTPGAGVRVEFDGDVAHADADASGHWRLQLPARGADDRPEVLRVEDDEGRIDIRDVLVGDVWLASGQSNMEWPIVRSADARAEIARATDPLIRHFKVPKSWGGAPRWQLAGGTWIASSPGVAGDFSAVAHFFAREMRELAGVPIGIIDSTWGGSRIEAWMDAEALGMDPAQVAARGRELRASDERRLAETRRNLARYGDLPADDAHWQDPAHDASGWSTATVPALWETTGWAGIDGVGWYRTSFSLTPDEAAGGLWLGVGRIDDTDTTWVNGERVGGLRGQYNVPRRYAVPAAVLRPGRNVVAIRVVDDGGGGGIHGGPDELFVQPEGGVARLLDGPWVFRPARVDIGLVEDKNQFPTLLYNAMVHPLQPYPLKGVIWYQGESNAGSLEDAARYRQQFPAMIGRWRAQWERPAMPFLWVQLASFGSGVDSPSGSPWAVLRESQSAALALPATAQAVAIDVGDVDDIHPADKQTVGKRLALAARHVAFGEDLPWHGPVPGDADVAGSEVTLAFESGAGALVARGGGAVRGFELAGDDGVFHAAQARVEGDVVVLRADGVPHPVELRYAWKDAPVDANLMNDAGLPASPFRQPLR
ncbi:beta galactosidase jelly roll domain-containing protein [Lysobacter sp. SG-8]|uniref:Beta galactosidase jelly roll domain-containing protein n=1 Tax=Marilutibacter penaei TaxID=2759900 RepID=A0A7W3U157_9GAMM|nr:sialate O-acetylesterase [Lysobacter penaei]MBB1086974.1 beta galactosidase jelly roll domain-containing protein [Lysobacter penaei]